MSTEGDRARRRVSSSTFVLYSDQCADEYYRAVIKPFDQFPRMEEDKPQTLVQCLILHCFAVFNCKITMPRQRHAILYGLLTMVVVMANAQSQYRVVGYYPMWSRATLPASAIKFESLTVVNHAFAWPNADGSIASYEANVDTALINTTHRAGRKILLSFGGAGSTQTANFAAVAADSALRKTFINNVVSRLATYHYDGADLDWEGPSSNADKLNEVVLVRELRRAFDAADTSWSITMAIGASNWSGQWRDFASLIPYVNWFNAMEYDFHGSWSAVAGHNAPISIGSDPVTDPDYFSIDQSIQYLAVTRAIPRSMLTLGLPFYGKLFGTSTLYTSYSGEQDLAYRDIQSTIQTGSWTYTWDTGSKAPYYSSVTPPKLITLDDSSSIAIKCQYARMQGLSGVMIWEITQDVIGQNQPLMDIVGTQMLSTAVVLGPTSDLHPVGFALYHNYPNPFNPSTTIQYQIPTASNVSIKVFDMLGREVATLIDENRNAGTGFVQFDASRYQISSGVYFYRIQAGTFVQTKRMVLVK
jgi:chitinase